VQSGIEINNYDNIYLMITSRKGRASASNIL